MTQIQLFKLAREKNGLEQQMTVCIEEMAELTKELTKVIRKQGDRQHLVEEIADVEITIAEMKYYFGCKNDVELQKIVKLNRLEKRLNVQ